MPKARSTRSVHNCSGGSHGTMICVKCGLVVSVGDYGLWTSQNGEFTVAHRRCAEADFKFDVYDLARLDYLASAKKCLEKYTKVYEEFGYAEAQSDMENSEREVAGYEEEIRDKFGDIDADKDASFQLYRFRFTIDIEDCRPVHWPIQYPYWCTGSGMRQFTVVAYGPSLEYIKDNWPHAQKATATPEDEVSFTTRFPRPSWLDDPEYTSVFGKNCFPKQGR